MPGVADVSAIRAALASADAGTVIIPDVESDADIVRIAAALAEARAAGRHVVVRSAAPLAAAIAGVTSTGLLPRPLVSSPRPTLLVCGSHTGAAGRQLARVEALRGPATAIDTDRALADPDAEGRRVAAVVGAALASGFAGIASARVRRAEHGDLAHGERVMTALTTAVAALRRSSEVVISKGGITSAEVASVGLGAGPPGCSDR